MERADVRDVAAAFAAADPDLTAMKLQKLVYYTQAWHLAEHGQPAFADEVQAWRQGPVVKALYDAHRGLRRVADLAWGEARRLPDSVRDVVALVAERYGRLSAEELSQITHRERPWREARGPLGPMARSGRPISNDAMRDYYRTQGGHRAERTKEVLATLRLEGLEPTPQGLARLEAVSSGRMSATEAVSQAVAAHRR